MPPTNESVEARTVRKGLIPVMVLMGAVFAANWITSSVERFQKFQTIYSGIRADPLGAIPALAKEQLAFVGWPASSVVRSEKDGALDAFFLQEEDVALQQLLKNIHPESTSPGCVVASPSTTRPDYWYQWTRDSALVMRYIVDKFVETEDKAYLKLIHEYIDATKDMQHRHTVLGDFSTGGLGEVKYHVDGAPFTGEWGRPQNDGPASRARTLILFAEHLLDNGTPEDEKFVREVLYDGKYPSTSVIKGDLEHVSTRWREPSFDLWEEVQGSHFYTFLVIQSSLMEGVRLAERLNDHGAAAWYRKQAGEVEELLPKFYSAEKGIIRVTVNHTKGRESEENAYVGDDSYGKASELDAAVLLATLHAPSKEWTGRKEVIKTLEELAKSMKPLYPLNRGRAGNGAALGRYPEDKYDGVGLSLAHPWFICTSAAAEVYYRTGLSTKSRSLATKYKKLGDEFAQIVQDYARPNGSLNEQFDRVTGEGRGARELTWSYAAFLTMAEARKALVKHLK